MVIMEIQALGHCTNLWMGRKLSHDRVKLMSLLVEWVPQLADPRSPRILPRCYSWIRSVCTHMILVDAPVWKKGSEWRILGKWMVSIGTILQWWGWKQVKDLRFEVYLKSHNRKWYFTAWFFLQRQHFFTSTGWNFYGQGAIMYLGFCRLWECLKKRPPGIINKITSASENICWVVFFTSEHLRKAAMKMIAAWGGQLWEGPERW